MTFSLIEVTGRELLLRDDDPGVQMGFSFDESANQKSGGW